MKDDELAEEYVMNHAKEAIQEQIPYFKFAEQMFLAGLKAGRPEWHDLRKAPTDLPKGYAENTKFLCSVKGETLFLIRYGSFWQGNFEVDAWCEIPTFNKE
jgi:hypothetical protein